MIRPTLIDLSSVEHNHYIFMISLDKCNRNCNAVDDAADLQKYVFLVKRKV